jgi:hypothetical protein
MTKKHFTELANIVQDAQDYICDSSRYRLACRIADYCETQNHLFNREKFLMACDLKI